MNIRSHNARDTMRSNDLFTQTRFTSEFADGRTEFAGVASLLNRTTGTKHA
jgi:hypothetical protein